VNEATRYVYRSRLVVSVVTSVLLGAVQISRQLHAEVPPNCACCSTPAVGDIVSFSVNNSGHDAILNFEIQGGADPNEYAAVYVADNPRGPALLIDALTNHAALMPNVNQWTDNLRLPPAGNYYYWLDYGRQPFAPRRSPNGLFPASNNPAFVSGPARPQLDPPVIESLEDIPFDLGGALRINWLDSSPQASADGFNIYRHSYPGGEPSYGKWEVIGWTGRNTLSFLDNTAVTGWVNNYQVSIAHHGEYSLQSDDGNFGIWNNFSTVASGSPINNFALQQITLLSADTLRVCPAGDDGTLEIEEIIWGNAGGPTVGVPAEMLACDVQSDSVIVCDGTALIVDGPTDATGRTTLTRSAIGGHGLADFVLRLTDPYVIFERVPVYFKSPDENGDGAVTVSDLGAFGSTYTSPPHTYVWYRDFNGDGYQQVGDYAYFYSHFNHSCEGSSFRHESYASLDASVELTFSEVTSASSTRLFFADVSIVGEVKFSVMQIGLRNENPALGFLRFEAGQYVGKALVTPATRDGVQEIAIGLVGSPVSVSDRLRVGRLVFSISGTADVVLAPSDFEVRVADALTSAGAARMSGGTSSSSRDVQRIVVNELAQNYPNPFNPSTTLVFSIATDARVELRIYDVRGAVVRTVVSERRPAGVYREKWDGLNDRGQPVASGVYFYRLVAGPFTDTRKMTLLR
jgi:hypothetical protein